MISGVCWRVCLLFVIGRCQSLMEEDLSNDYPFDVPQHQTSTVRVKNGTPLTLKCHQERAKWDFKPCDSNFYGIVCNENIHWKRLENETRGRMHFKAINKGHNGLYRCSRNGDPIKTFKLDVYDPSYTGTPPIVNPLQTSNITGPINMEFTIQCKVTSEIPPTIIWFKSCFGQKCDFRYHQNCYCHINTSISNYSTGSTYLSKYLIFNARDVDSGTYICLAVNQFGKDDQNVTISVPCKETDGRKKSVVIIVDQQKQLIRPVGQVI